MTLCALLPLIIVINKWKKNWESCKTIDLFIIILEKLEKDIHISCHKIIALTYI